MPPLADPLYNISGKKNKIRIIFPVYKRKLAYLAGWRSKKIFIPEYFEYLIDAFNHVIEITCNPEANAHLARYLF
jgi:hypothetical protein